MLDPNSNDLINRLIAQRRLQHQTVPAAQPFDGDDAAAQCLALLCDPEAEMVPAEAWQALAKQNDALLTAPKATIKRALARQAALLQAAATRYMTRAATTAKPEHAAALMAISLGCNRALVNVLGAINAMDEAEKDSHAIEV